MKEEAIMFLVPRQKLVYVSWFMDLIIVDIKELERLY